MNSATQSFLGRYRLVKVLGQGAMGVVYEAVDTRLNRTVAIKTVLRSHLADETTANDYATRFEREAQAAARLSHPHVVTVFDFGEHEDISYIVMEFIRGRELNQAFESGEKFPLPEAIRMMRELLMALDYAHQQGIVHRDIKPANVMLDPAGRVKLTDFGVARVVNANQDRTMPGTLVGTPSYMSPEQILGLAVGSRADIFAAGVILYQFLTGKRPFTGGGPFGVQRKIVQDDPEPPSRVNPAVPQGFDLIIARALAKQPENRYENAAAFAADLERIGTTLPREVPLIDLDLPDEAHAARVAPPAPAVPGTPPPMDPNGLTLITEVPFGSAVPARTPATDPDEPPLDPEATIIMFRPSQARPASAQASTVAPGTAVGRSAAAPAAARPAPTGTSPSAPPKPGSTRAQAAAPPPPRPPASAPAPPPLRTPAPASRRPPAPPQAQQAYARPAFLPLAAGASVAILVLTGWMLVARPWAGKPSPARVTPVPQAASRVATPAAKPAPMVPVPPAATLAASAPMSTARTVSNSTLQPGTNDGATPRAAASARTTSPGRADPASPRRAATEPAAKPAPARTEPRSTGNEPRCSDLLQRMQLGEPLTPDQTSFFQSRCTR